MFKQLPARLNSFFKLEENHATVRTELMASLTTFITVAYILILNPQILSHPYEIMGDMDMATKISNGVFIGTCLASFVGTILCALYAKVSFVQVPGMGLNAFFAYTVVLAMGYTYAQALVVVFISGILFIVITKIGLREAIIRAIPDSVINAVTPGVGLFITIIGLKNSGLVISNESTTGQSGGLLPVAHAGRRPHRSLRRTGRPDRSGGDRRPAHQEGARLHFHRHRCSAA